MKKFSKKQWIKFSIAAVLYLLFTLWMQNAWLLLGLIVLFDIFFKSRFIINSSMSLLIYAKQIVYVAFIWTISSVNDKI